MSTLGTCSICGGAVQVPSIWGGTIPPVPTCTKCGATPSKPHGPTIPMEPRRPPIVRPGNPSSKFPVDGNSDDRPYATDLDRVGLDRVGLDRVGPVRSGSLRPFKEES